MTIELLQGDLSKKNMDCMVNAAKFLFLRDGDVDVASQNLGRTEILNSFRNIID